MFTESEYAFWISLSKHFTKLDQDIIFGSVYTPPCQSRFLNEDEFETFQRDVMSICSKYEYVYISGAMNAQTADMTDFTTDDKLFDSFFCFFFDEEIRRFYDQKSILQSLNKQLQRKSHDRKKNNNGYRLIELCKNNNLTILNGRFGQDKNVGNYTFRDTSVIDYILSSSKSLKIRSDFNITMFDLLLLDGNLSSFEFITKIDSE